MGLDDTGLSGNGWVNTSLPYLVVERNQVVDGHTAIVSVIENSQAQQLFYSGDSNDDNDTAMQPMYDGPSQLAYIPPTETTVGETTTYSPGEFQLNDSSGDIITFYDLPRDPATGDDHQVTVDGTDETVGRIYNPSGYAQQVTNQWGLDGSSTTTTAMYPFGAFKSMTDPPAPEVTTPPETLLATVAYW